MSDENDSIESCHQEIDELRQLLREMIRFATMNPYYLGPEHRELIRKAKKLAWPEGDEP